MAGHLGLGKLTWLYDANDVSLDGPLSMSFSEDVRARFEAQGWHVEVVEDGDNDLEAIDAALSAAKADTGRPSLILVKTTIGYGSPNRAGTCSAHGSPLGADESALTKAALGWEATEPFHVPEEVRAVCAERAAAGGQRRRAWQARFDEWAAANPALAQEWQLAQAGQLPAGWDEELPRFEAGTSLATRSAAGKALNALAPKVPWLFGGDADLAGSTKTTLADAGQFSATENGRNVHFGVREHAMGAIANGVCYHGGARPFVSTFFVFSDYVRPTLRLAAMNRLPAVHVYTHDSVGVGEDGPTHQPVEHLASLRAIPGLTVLRPGDANEAAEAWRVALAKHDGPSLLVLSRQNLPVWPEGLERSEAGVPRGGYVYAEPESGDTRAILIATGSELALAMQARAELAKAGIGVRVVSLVSWELFEAQSADYRAEVLPADITTRVSIEAGVGLGWHRWVGERGAVIAMDRFGASAPGDVLFQKFGFTAERVVQTVRALLGTEVTTG